MAQRRSLPLLAHAHVTLEYATPALAALPHVVSLLSEYLDGSARVSLATAASIGSTRLLERIATHLSDDHQLSAALRRHWFARAMQVAMEKNDLPMIQKIHEFHPEPLMVYSLGLAMQHGTLETIQWIVERRQDRRCCAPGIQNLCVRCGLKAVRRLGKQDAFRVIQWLLDNGLPLTLETGDFMASPLLRILLHSVKLLRWYDECGLLSDEITDDLWTSGIPSEHIENVDVDVVEYLRQGGRSVSQEKLIAVLIRGSCQRDKEAAVMSLVSSSLCDALRQSFTYAPIRPGGAKVLQWSWEFMSDVRNSSVWNQMAYYASAYTHVDSAQWLFGTWAIEIPAVRVRVLSTQEDTLRFFEYMKANEFDLGSLGDIAAAAHRGYLGVVQWLDGNADGIRSPRAMDAAAANG